VIVSLAARGSGGASFSAPERDLVCDATVGWGGEVGLLRLVLLDLLEELLGFG